MTKLFICSVVLLAVVIMNSNAQLAGGLGASKPADDEVKDLVGRQRANIIKKICESGSSCPKSDAEIVVNNYKTQTVAGTNYFVGCTIEDIVYHVRIFVQSWTNTEKVHAVEGPKAISDEIKYFY